VAACAELVLAGKEQLLGSPQYQQLQQSMAAAVVQYSDGAARGGSSPWRMPGVPPREPPPHRPVPTNDGRGTAWQWDQVGELAAFGLGSLGQYRTLLSSGQRSRQVGTAPLRAAAARPARPHAARPPSDAHQCTDAVGPQGCKACFLWRHGFAAA
jgi:hypothetical protein